MEKYNDFECRFIYLLILGESYVCVSYNRSIYDLCSVDSFLFFPKKQEC